MNVTLAVALRDDHGTREDGDARRPTASVDELHGQRRSRRPSGRRGSSRRSRARRSAPRTSTRRLARSREVLRSRSACSRAAVCRSVRITPPRAACRRAASATTSESCWTIAPASDRRIGAARIRQSAGADGAEALRRAAVEASSRARRCGAIPRRRDRAGPWPRTCAMRRAAAPVERATPARSRAGRLRYRRRLRVTAGAWPCMQACSCVIYRFSDRASRAAPVR